MQKKYLSKKIQIFYLDLFYFFFTVYVFVFHSRGVSDVIVEGLVSDAGAVIVAGVSE